MKGQTKPIADNKTKERRSRTLQRNILFNNANETHCKMKTSLFKLFSIILKSFLAVAAISLLCFFAVAVKTKEMTDDVWQQLGLTLPDAELNIKNSILQ